MGDIVTFGVDGLVYGAPVEWLDGVDTLGAITRLPGAPGYVRGLTNRRGYLLPVLDLSALLGRSPRDSDRPLIVTLKAGPLVAALGVDDAPNIVSIAEEDIRPTTHTPSDLLEGSVVSDAHGEIAILRPEALLRVAIVHE